MRVAVRVDGSAEIGSGHVLRCIALAHALRTAGVEVRFLLRDLGVDFGDRLAAEGFDWERLRPAASADAAGHSGWAGVTEEEDAAETVERLSGWRSDWVVVDHYSFAAPWHRAVADRLGCRIAAIDDLGDRPIAADLMIDHNPSPDHGAKYGELAGSIGRLLGGPRYALLAPAYRDAPRHVPRPEVRSIGIFMGGIDRPDCTTLALRACREGAGFEGPIEIVSTSANPHLAALREAVDRDSSASLTLDMADLAAFFARHDLQIGAGGGASWERCRIAAPAIVLKCADNQAVVTAGLREADAAIAIDDPEHGSVGEAIGRAIGDPGLRRRIAENAARLVDGRGAERVALAMVGEVALREAGEADAAMAYEWRNHSETRRYFRDPAPIAAEGHRDWWRRTMAAPDRDLLIATAGDFSVGVLRLDVEAKEAEISIYVDPALAGLGFGTAMLRAALGWAARERPALSRLTAEVHSANSASQKLFEAAGYRAAGGGKWVRDMD